MRAEHARELEAVERQRDAAELARAQSVAEWGEDLRRVEEQREAVFAREREARARAEAAEDSLAALALTHKSALSAEDRAADVGTQRNPPFGASCRARAGGGAGGCRAGAGARETSQHHRCCQTTLRTGHLRSAKRRNRSWRPVKGGSIGATRGLYLLTLGRNRRQRVFAIVPARIKPPTGIRSTATSPLLHECCSLRPGRLGDAQLRREGWPSKRDCVVARGARDHCQPVVPPRLRSRWRARLSARAKLLRVLHPRQRMVMMKRVGKARQLPSKRRFQRTVTRKASARQRKSPGPRDRSVPQAGAAGLRLVLVASRRPRVASSLGSSLSSECPPRARAPHLGNSSSESRVSAGSYPQLRRLQVRVRRL